MRILSSRDSFLDHFGDPKEVKIDQKSSSDDVKNERSENVDFWYPSLAKSMFWGPNEGQDGGQMSSEIDFYSDWKWWWKSDAIQRGVGVVKTSVRMKFWAQAEEGFREELASDTELNLQMKGSADL